MVGSVCSADVAVWLGSRKNFLVKEAWANPAPLSYSSSVLSVASPIYSSFYFSTRGIEILSASGVRAKALLWSDF